MASLIPSARPSAEATSPPTTTASLSLRRGGGVAGESGTIRSLRSDATSLLEPSADEQRRVDKLAPATVLWPDLGQEVVEMRSNEASCLVQSSDWRGHDERHSEHSVWQVLGGESDDEVAQLPVRVLLSVRIRQSQGERAEEEDSAHA